jgi:periplasmic divalent cation tolerance protein
MKKMDDMNTNEYAVVTTACANEDEADKIASVLIHKKLAACVQMLPVSSRYIWNGELCSDKEVLLLIKGRRDNYAAIEQVILENHSYDLPEILLTPVEGGYKKYLKWLDACGSVNHCSESEETTP